MAWGQSDAWQHGLRRLIHLSIAGVPFLYGQWYVHSAWAQFMSPNHVLWGVFFLTITLEAGRLYKGVLLPGQRSYERFQISALAWGACAVVGALLFLPYRYYLPILWCLAFVDPLMGELRRFLSPWFVRSAGCLVAVLIWWLCLSPGHLPWWMPWLMGPVVVVCEWPSWRWIDDNALLVLGPLCVVQVWACLAG